MINHENQKREQKHLSKGGNRLKYRELWWGQSLKKETFSGDSTDIVKSEISIEYYMLIGAWYSKWSLKKENVISDLKSEFKNFEHGLDVKGWLALIRKQEKKWKTKGNGRMITPSIKIETNEK